MQKRGTALGAFTAIVSLSAQAATVVNDITGTQTASENGCSSAIPAANADDCSYHAGDPLGTGGDGWIGPTDRAATYAISTAPAGSTVAGFQGIPADGRTELPISGRVIIDDNGNGFGADDLFRWTYTLGAGQRHVGTGISSSATESWTSVVHRLSPVAATSVVPNGSGGFDYTFGLPVTPLDPDGTINTTPFPSDVASIAAGPGMLGTSAWISPATTPPLVGPIAYTFESNCVDPLICGLTGASGPFGSLTGEFIVDGSALADGMATLAEGFTTNVATDGNPNFVVNQTSAEEFLLSIDANGNVIGFDFHSDLDVRAHLVWHPGSTANPGATHTEGITNIGLGINCDDEPFVAGGNCGAAANPISDPWIWNNPIAPIPGTSIVSFEGNTGVQEDLETLADIAGYTCDDGGALPAAPGCTAGSSALLGSNAVIGGDPDGSFRFENVVGTISTDATGAIVAAQLFAVQETDDDMAGPALDSWSATILSFTGTLTTCNDNVDAIDDSFSVINDAMPVDLDVLANDECTTDPPIAVVALAGDLVPDQGGMAVIGAGAANVTYTPLAGVVGLETFTYTAQDAGVVGSPPAVDQDTATTTVNLLANTQPTAGTGSVSASPGVPVDIDVAADIPGNSLGNTETNAVNSVAAVVTATNGATGTTSVAGTVITYTPAGGDDSFTYTITDTNGESAMGTINVTIDNVLPVANDGTAPAIDTQGVAPDSQTSSLDVTTISGNDLGDQPSTVTATDGALGTVTVNGNTVSYTPNAGFFAGADAFQYTITDAQGDMATGMIAIDLTDAQPTAGVVLANTNQEQAVQIDLGPSITLGNGRELDHGFAITIDPNEGTAMLGSPTVIYTPAAGFSGTDVFEYTVTDGDGSQASATVTVNVVAAHQPGTSGKSSGVGLLSIAMLLLVTWLRRTGYA